MIVQIDAGNTRFHWRCLDHAGHPLPGGEAAGVGAYYEPVDWPDAGRVTRVELASVAGHQKHQWLVGELRRFSGATIVEAEPRSFQAGVRNGYPDPDQMGVDRWLAMIGAHHHFPGGVIVVDAGTAVTVDYVDPAGAHLGGYILPGLSMMLSGLDRDTGRVSVTRQLECGPEPGRSTGACVNAGLAWLWQGMAGELEKDRERMGLARIVATGGDAARLVTVSPAAVVHCPELVFLGMDRYWGR